MAIFALTGSLASGKSTVLRLLKKRGAGTFDADKKIHQYYKDKKGNMYKQVASVFPRAARANTISRKILAEIIFADNGRRKKLERIVHPIIISDLKAWIRCVKKRKGVFVAEVPLLFEKKLQGLFDGVILIYAKRSNLIERGRKKLHSSKKEIEERLALYMPVKNKIKNADFVIQNNSGIRQLKEQVDSLWRKLINFSNQ
ncbi:MAG: dephospho-CoA kinase [Candidatus Omnitrophota bacterium]|nr:MAG: dephospho-CoA kinase [Candidatus Omnitrophota bacterium]